MRKKQPILLAGIAGSLIFLSLIGIRIWKTNQNIPLPPHKTFALNTPLDLTNVHYFFGDPAPEGYQVTIRQAECLSYEDFLKKYDIKEDSKHPIIDRQRPDFPDYVYDLDMWIENKNKEETEIGMDLTYYHLYGSFFCMDLADELFFRANPSTQNSLMFSLKPQTGKEFHIPYGLSVHKKSTLTLDKVQNATLYWIASLYPIRKQIQVQ